MAGTDMGQPVYINHEVQKTRAGYKHPGKVLTKDVPSYIRFMIPIARTRCGVLFCMMLCIIFFLIAPVQAFTADSLNITVGTNGDAIADFHFTLQGVIENAIPLSVLQDQMTKGLATSSEPPQVLTFSKSEATLLLKGFAVTNTVPAGTEYQTSPMDFTKAQVALQNSAAGSVITADFSPAITTVTFPDGYSRQFIAQSTLPSVDHIVTFSPAQAGAGASGAIQVNTSPEHTRVFIDSAFAGESPGLFSGIAPGNHQILLEADGFEPLSENITVTAGETAHLAEILLYATTPTPQSGAPGVASGIAAVALTGSGILLLHRRKA